MVSQVPVLLKGSLVVASVIHVSGQQQHILMLRGRDCYPETSDNTNHWCCDDV